MPENYAERRAALFDRLPDDVGTVFVAPSETLRYLTGLEMHKSERPALFAQQRDAPPAVVLPELETDRVRDAVGDGADFFVYGDATDPVAAARSAFESFVDARGVGDRVAAEFESTRLLEYDVVSNEVAWGDVVDAGDAVAYLRARKTAGEFDRLRRAADIIDEVLAAVVADVEVGMTEMEVARDLRKRVLDSDADAVGALVVASGPNTAKPHTNTGHREIRAGDPLMIDAGVVYEGYYSDITRTFSVGEPNDEEFSRIHEVVQRAAREARDAVAEGTPLQDVDRAARDVIEAAGYGEYFTHRVGHGIGLEGHERPYLVEGNDAPMAVGHAVTVEPGVYVDGLGGVRVEDDVILTENGPEVMTSSPRGLRQL